MDSLERLVGIDYNKNNKSYYRDCYLPTTTIATTTAATIAMLYHRYCLRLVLLPLLRLLL